MTSSCQDLESKILQREEILSSAISAAEEMEKETKAINEGLYFSDVYYGNRSCILPAKCPNMIVIKVFAFKSRNFLKSLCIVS